MTLISAAGFLLRSAYNPLQLELPCCFNTFKKTLIIGGRNMLHSFPSWHVSSHFSSFIDTGKYKRSTGKIHRYLGLMVCRHISMSSSFAMPETFLYNFSNTSAHFSRFDKIWSFFGNEDCMIYEIDIFSVSIAVSDFFVLRK